LSVAQEHDDLTGEGTSPWPAFADLLAASTLLFLILFAAVAIPAIRRAGIAEAQQSRIANLKRGLTPNSSDSSFRVQQVGDYLLVSIPERATFPKDSFELRNLRPEGRDILLKLVNRIRNDTTLLNAIDQIQVVGHTSSEGSDAHNWVLSSKRATTVAQFLVDSARWPPCAITALGRGRYYPVSPDSARVTTARFERDRRIELEVRPVIEGDSSQKRRREGCVEKTGEEGAHVRQVFNEVQSAIATGSLLTERRACTDGATLATYRDAARRVRKRELRKTLGAVVASAEYYYDEASGQLRFALLARRLPSAAAEETRLYFDSSGRQIARLVTPATVAMPGIGLVLADSSPTSPLTACQNGPAVP
jgi:outer membrane protein OmpA-like peptidoglycan-associated protein